jgi:hypothetical protein
MELPYTKLCLHTRSCAYTGQDISLLYHLQCSTHCCRMVAGWVCFCTHYLLPTSEDVLLPLSNVFYFVVIAGGPVINNLFVKIKISLFLL